MSETLKKMINDKFYEAFTSVLTELAPSLVNLESSEDVIKALNSFGNKPEKKSTVKKAATKKVVEEDSEETIPVVEKKKPIKKPVAKKSAPPVEEEDSEEIPEVVEKKKPAAKKPTAKKTAPVDEEAPEEKKKPAAKKAAPKKAANGNGTTKKKKTSATPDEEVDALIDKQTRNDSLQITENKHGILVHTESGIAFNENTEVIGIISKDGKKVLPLDDKSTKWVETHGMEIGEDAVTAPAKKPAAKKAAPVVDEEEAEDPEEELEQEDE